MHLYLKLGDTFVEILNPSMSTVREVADRLSTLSHKHNYALDTEIVYRNDEVGSSVTYVTSLVDEAICMIQSECEELESNVSSKLEEIKQALISKLDDSNFLVIDGRKCLKASMKIGGFRHEFEIRVRPDLITVDSKWLSAANGVSYSFNDVSALVDDIINLQKIANELNQSLVQSVFGSMFE